MSDIPPPKAVEQEGEYIHIRYRDPDEFEMIRTPDWADTVSDSVVTGSKLRMGKLPDADDWKPQSVLIPDDTDRESAKMKAAEILRKIQS